MSDLADILPFLETGKRSPDTQVPPELQRQRDGVRLKMLQNERSQESDPNIQKALDTEIKATGGAVSAPTGDLGSIADILDTGAPVRNAATASQKPPPSPSTGQVATGLWNLSQALPTVSPMGLAAEGVKPAASVVANQVSGIGASIIGGYRGLYELARGGSLDDASAAVHQEVSQRTAQPEPGTLAATSVENFNSPWNPMTWPGLLAKKGGETAQDLGASPAVAAGVETVGNAAQLLLLRKAGETNVNLLKGGAKAVIENKPGQTVPMSLATMEKAAQPTVFDRIEAATTPQEAAATATAEAPKFTEAQTPIGNSSAAVSDQARRAKILQSVGIDEAHAGAVEGNRAAAKTDLDLSRIDESGKLAEVIDNERKALTRHAEKIVEDTGGSLGMGESERVGRGNVILKPLESLKQWFDSRIKEFYNNARANGVDAISADRYRALSQDDAEFLGTSEGEALLKGIRANEKRLGLDAESNPTGTISVNQAERMRQWLGDKWTPRTSRFIGKLKDALDDDVTEAAGSDIYQKARAVRAMKSAVFENDVLDPQGRLIPNGITKMVDASGKNIELVPRDGPKAVPDIVTQMPVDQLAQVVQRLKNVPAEIQPEAKAALAEIKGHFANKILEAGSKREAQWGAPDVTKFLSANSAKMRLLFNDAELARIQNLNDAGHILRFESYPGAGVQTQNLGRAVAAGAVKSGLTGAGTLISSMITGEPVTGGIAGRAAGEMIGSRMDKSAITKAAKNRVVKLSDFAK